MEIWEIALALIIGAVIGVAIVKLVEAAFNL